MVKADAKHDYYADLEIPVSADAETIKKQFRLLAKQYHPDRNPGRETEVVAKFQAVQAAHEILSDVQQKTKYDSARAQYIRKQDPDPYPFKRAQTFKPAATHPSYQQPPPRSRNASADRSQPASASAEKFTPFTRGIPSSWDRAKYEDAAAKAEALRNFQSMRSQPPHPPRPGRAPTAPKSGSTAMPTDNGYADGPSPGFPGMSRTQEMPRRQGFSPAMPGMDEPPAKSAYAYVHSSRERGSMHGYSYRDSSQPPPSNPTSPNSQRPYPQGSPVATSQSTEARDGHRPVLGRTPSRYAAHSGEKTDIGAGLGRSASVRNPSSRRLFGEQGPFGTRERSSQEFRPAPPPRYHSASPKLRPREGARVEFSASETSSSEDEAVHLRDRAKAVPRRRRREGANGSASNDPALTGHFSNKNYTRIVDDTHYNYPPPEARDAPTRRPFDPISPVDDVTHSLNASGMKSTMADSPKTRYEFPLVNRWLPPNPWDNPRYATVSSTIKGVPSWALPATVYPKAQPIRQFKAQSAHEQSHFLQCRDGPKIPSFVTSEADLKQRSHSNLHTSGSAHDVPRGRSQHQTSFSASDWDGKFSDEQNYFRPNEHDRRSPTKSSRPRMPQRGRPATVEVDGESSSDTSATTQSTQPSHSGSYAPKRAASQYATFSAEEWDRKMRIHGSTGASQHPSQRPRFSQYAKIEDDLEAQSPTVIDGSDAMDVDSSGPNQANSIPTIKVDPAPQINPSSGVPKVSDSRIPRNGEGGFKLSDLAHVAPLKASGEGLDSLSADLNGSLPFQSQPADQVRISERPRVTLKGLNLPKPPSPILPPEQLTQDKWENYCQKMQKYIHDWHEFNTKMIDFFRVRQEKIHTNLYQNWVMGEGDGASTDDFDDPDINLRPESSGSGSTDGSKPKGGHSTYMQWLEQDALCRQRWELAFEEHRECLDGLGKTRQAVKALRRARDGASHNVNTGNPN